MRNIKMYNTWNMAVESNLKPSDPGCLTRDRADGSSTASTALKLTSPNTRAWVSGWALSWCVRLREKKKERKKEFSCKILSYTSLHTEITTLKPEYTHKNLESIEQWRGVSQAAKFKLGRVVLWYISISASAEEHLLYATEERVSQVLHRVHHHTAIDRITWKKGRKL